MQCHCHLSSSSRAFSLNLRSGPNWATPSLN